MAEFILQQDFFLEYIVLRESIGLFITLSELNKDFNSAIKLYKENKTTWLFLCKRDVLKYMPKDNNEWSLEFSKIKPGNYFAMYYYLNKVLNREFDTSKESQGILINDHESSLQPAENPNLYKEVITAIPLYFILKNYNAKNHLSHIPRSTRKIAIIIRVIDCEENPIVIMKNFLTMSINAVPNTTLFTYTVCANKDCLDCEIIEDLRLCGTIYNPFLPITDNVHLRDEDNCSECMGEDLDERQGLGIGTVNISGRWGFENLNHQHSASKKHYKDCSLLFLKNKIFSLA